MTIPVVTIAVGAFLLWCAITGQNPITVLKSVLATGTVPAKPTPATPATTPTR